MTKLARHYLAWLISSLLAFTMIGTAVYAWLQEYHVKAPVVTEYAPHFIIKSFSGKEIGRVNSLCMVEVRNTHILTDEGMKAALETLQAKADDCWFRKNQVAGTGN